MIVQNTNFGIHGTVACGIHDPAHNYGTHIHQATEIVYVLDGYIESTVNGHTDILKAGDMAVITPLRPHSTYTPDRCRILICVFANDLIMDFIPSIELYKGYGKNAFTPSPSLTAYLNDKLLNTAMSFPHNEEKIRTLQSCIHAILAEFTASAKPIEKDASSTVLAKTLLYINEHFKENLTLKAIGKELGYYPGYISHCLELLPNFNFTDLLNSFRIDHAKALILSSKNYSNLDIALECGFTCERSFYRAFKKHTGITPKKYVNSRSPDIIPSKQQIKKQ